MIIIVSKINTKPINAAPNTMIDPKTMMYNIGRVQVSILRDIIPTIEVENMIEAMTDSRTGEECITMIHTMVITEGLMIAVGEMKTNHFLMLLEAKKTTTAEDLEDSTRGI